MDEYEEGEYVSEKTRKAELESEQIDTLLRCEKKEKYDSEEDKAFYDFLCFLLHFLGTKTISQSAVDSIKNARNLLNLNGELLALVVYYNIISNKYKKNIADFIDQDKYAKNYEPVDIIRYMKIYDKIRSNK